jgi:hypothetical protein
MEIAAARGAAAEVPRDALDSAIYREHVMREGVKVRG